VSAGGIVVVVMLALGVAVSIAPQFLRDTQVGVVVVGAGGFGAMIPAGFVPEEDQGIVGVGLQLPPGASLQRTDEVMKKVEAIVAKTGMEGLSLARKHRPTAISLDVFLPDMLGWTVLSRLKQDPALHFRAGGPGSSRELNILIGKNVEAGRLLAGVTFSDPGNWTSWPPHEHSKLLEEAYLFIDMPSPSFGVQFVYTNPDDPEFLAIVRDGDAVLDAAGLELPHPRMAELLPDVEVYYKTVHDALAYQEFFDPKEIDSQLKAFGEK